MNKITCQTSQISTKSKAEMARPIIAVPYASLVSVDADV